VSKDTIESKVQLGILKSANKDNKAIVEPDKMNKYFITTSTGRMENGKTSNEYKNSLKF